MKISKTAAWSLLVVLLAATAYMVYTAGGWNWAGGGQRTDNGGLEDVLFETNDPEEWDLNEGETFFIEYRLERERVRSRQLDILQQTINNPNVSDDTKLEAEERVLELQQTMELELMVENSIKAQGFDDAIFIMQEHGALVVVAGTELSREEISLLAQTAARSVGLSPAEITVSLQSGK